MSQKTKLGINNRKTLSENITQAVKQALQNSGVPDLPVYNELSKLIESRYFGGLFFAFSVCW